MRPGGSIPMRSDAGHAALPEISPLLRMGEAPGCRRPKRLMEP